MNEIRRVPLQVLFFFYILIVFDLYAANARAYEWDIAAGHTIVKHAGGIVTTLDKKEFKYGKTDYKNLAILVRRSENLER